MRKVFSIVSILAVLAVVVQFYFAGMGVFSAPEDELFGIHAMSGRIALPVVFILSLITAALARAGRSTIWLTALAILLLAIQTLLFIITGAIFNVGPESADVPLAATLLVSLHVINGLAILAVTGVIARRASVLAWRSAPGIAAELRPEPAVPTT